MDSELRILSIDEIEPERVLWLWKPYIPLGKICVVMGNPGVGKSSAALAIAAGLTRGAMPGESDVDAPSSVIYQTAEDGYADTVKPRLQRLGADCSRVFMVVDRELPLTLMDGRIEQAIAQSGAKMFIADPL